MLITLDEMIVHRIFMIVIAKYHVKATRRVLADLPPPPPSPTTGFGPSDPIFRGKGWRANRLCHQHQIFPLCFLQIKHSYLW